MASPAVPSNSSTIGRNSFWYGIDVASGVLVALATSVLIAKVYGPARLSHYLFIAWMTSTTASVGCMGLPITTRKFMAEFLASGDTGKARAVFDFSLRRQIIVSAAVTAVAMVLVFLLERPQHRLMTGLMVASFIPTMVKYIPSQANNAAENMAANVISSVSAGLVYLTGVLLCIYFGWGLAAIAATTFTMQVTELTLRIIPVQRWMRTLPREPLDADLKRRLTSFSGKNLVLMALNLVVWDRSEFFFLNRMSADVQLTYFSVSFNITEKLLLLPKVIGFAGGSTIMAQYGRDRSKVGSTVSAMLRLLALWAFAAHAALAALAVPVMVIYGYRFLPAAVPLAISSLLGVWKAFLIPVQDALQGAEKTGLLVKWGLASAVITLTLDYFLIGHYGAIGAATANGVAQMIGTFLLFAIASRALGFRPPLLFMARLLAISLVLGGVMFSIVRTWPGVGGTAVSVCLAGPLYFVLLKITGGLQNDDADRLNQVVGRLPGRSGRVFERLLAFLSPPAARSDTP